MLFLEKFTILGNWTWTIGEVYNWNVFLEFILMNIRFLRLTQREINENLVSNNANNDETEVLLFTRHRNVLAWWQRRTLKVDLVWPSRLFNSWWSLFCTFSFKQATFNWLLYMQLTMFVNLVMILHCYRYFSDFRRVFIGRDKLYEKQIPIA